jgi:hypothetical protein
MTAAMAVGTDRLTFFKLELQLFQIDPHPHGIGYLEFLLDAGFMMEVEHHRIIDAAIYASFVDHICAEEFPDVLSALEIPGWAMFIPLGLAWIGCWGSSVLMIGGMP